MGSRQRIVLLGGALRGTLRGDRLGALLVFTFLICILHVLKVFLGHLLERHILVRRNCVERCLLWTVLWMLVGLRVVW